MKYFFLPLIIILLSIANPLFGQTRNTRAKFFTLIKLYFDNNSCTIGIDGKDKVEERNCEIVNSTQKKDRINKKQGQEFSQTAFGMDKTEYIVCWLLAEHIKYSILAYDEFKIHDVKNLKLACQMLDSAKNQWQILNDNPTGNSVKIEQYGKNLTINDNFFEKLDERFNTLFGNDCSRYTNIQRPPTVPKWNIKSIGLNLQNYKIRLQSILSMPSRNEKERKLYLDSLNVLEKEFEGLKQKIILSPFPMSEEEKKQNNSLIGDIDINLKNIKEKKVALKNEDTKKAELILPQTIKYTDISPFQSFNLDSLEKISKNLEFITNEQPMKLIASVSGETFDSLIRKTYGGAGGQAGINSEMLNYIFGSIIQYNHDRLEKHSKIKEKIKNLTGGRFDNEKRNALSRLNRNDRVEIEHFVLPNLASMGDSYSRVPVAQFIKANLRQTRLKDGVSYIAHRQGNKTEMEEYLVSIEVTNDSGDDIEFDIETGTILLGIETTPKQSLILIGITNATIDRKKVSDEDKNNDYMFTYTVPNKKKLILTAKTFCRRSFLNPPEYFLRILPLTRNTTVTPTTTDKQVKQDELERKTTIEGYFAFESGDSTTNWDKKVMQGLKNIFEKIDKDVKDVFLYRQDIGTNKVDTEGNYKSTSTNCGSPNGATIVFHINISQPETEKNYSDFKVFICKTGLIDKKVIDGKLLVGAFIQITDPKKSNSIMKRYSKLISNILMQYTTNPSD